MKRKGDCLIFENGRMIDANCGILGIGESWDGKTTDVPSISGGYDDAIWEQDELTPAEREEMAAYAIGLWTRWAKEGLIS